MEIKISKQKLLLIELRTMSSSSPVYEDSGRMNRRLETKHKNNSEISFYQEKFIFVVTICDNIFKFDNISSNIFHFEIFSRVSANSKLHDFVGKSHQFF